MMQILLRKVTVSNMAEEMSAEEKAEFEKLLADVESSNLMKDPTEEGAKDAH